MNRRDLLIGLGGIVAGGAAVTGGIYSCVNYLDGQTVEGAEMWTQGGIKCLKLNKRNKSAAEYIETASDKRWDKRWCVTYAPKDSTSAGDRIGASEVGRENGIVSYVIDDKKFYLGSIDRQGRAYLFSDKEKAKDFGKKGRGK